MPCHALLPTLPPPSGAGSQANLDRNSLMAQANMQYLNASAARDDVMWCVRCVPASPVAAGPAAGPAVAAGSAHC